MYVEKIEVPAFRVLRNVVLEFDRGFEPRIFPLGSENGGGKSTLLQLLFALLHCSSDPERFQYLANLLATDAQAADEEERLIARLTIRLNDEQHVLEFVSLNDGFLKRHLGEDAVPVGFVAESRGKFSNNRSSDLNNRLERYQMALKRDLNALFKGGFVNLSITKLLGESSFRRPRLRNAEELHSYIKAQIDDLRAEIDEIRTGTELLTDEMNRIENILVEHDYKFIATYSHVVSMEFEPEARAIVCRASGQSALKTEAILAAVSSKIYLLGPSNQQYLFLNKLARKALLKSQRRDSNIDSDDDAGGARPQIQYMHHLDHAESVMPGFFAYDWLSVDPLVQLFVAARNEDFQHKVKSGEYGNRYSELLNEANGLLLGKQVRPLIDSESGLVSGIEFIVVRSDGQETPLSPEDLSQGELKRLMIYAWLRAHRAVDALVLIDEIEASFHPDWQYGIVRDLQEWAPKNQYILATHSYELCTALTPNHVRTLEPPLRPGQTAPSSGQK